jgi:anti-sigma-K factor RskA
MPVEAGVPPSRAFSDRLAFFFSSLGRGRMPAWGLISLALIAILVVNGLDVLPLDKQYQLWLAVGDRRDSGGVFSVSRSGYGALEISAPQPLREYARVGITIEPSGGSPGPTGDRVLGGDL